MNKLNLIKELVNDGGSATFGQFTAMVEQKLRKTGNPLRDATITKLVTYNILLNAVYANMVNNRLQKEGKDATFVAQKNWFEKSFDGKNGSLVHHAADSNLPIEERRNYLFFACNNAETHGYFVNGIAATPKETELIREFKISSTPKNQGLDNPVIVRTVKLSGIKEIRCNKVKVNFA